jgi:hypothetical protein
LPVPLADLTFQHGYDRGVVVGLPIKPSSTDTDRSDVVDFSAPAFERTRGNRGYSALIRAMVL